MSRLEEAQQKLDAALGRLDAAVDRRLVENARTGTVAEAELTAVKAEKDRLESTADTVAGHLDRTIERLQRLLEG